MDNPTELAPAPVDRSAIAALVLGFVSLVALVFPPALGLGVAAIVIGWTARRRIARSTTAVRGSAFAIIGLVLGVIGTLEALVLPGIVAFVYIYAAFHGGQIPGNGLP